MTILQRDTDWEEFLQEEHDAHAEYEGESYEGCAECWPEVYFTPVAEPDREDQVAEVARVGIWFEVWRSMGKPTFISVKISAADCYRPVMVGAPIEEEK